MKHKYLHELYPDGRITWPYGEEDYPDFDERDTYDMDYTLIAWLYERLRYFQDFVSTQIVMDDPEWHTWEIDGEKLTQLQCINRMVDDCKIILLKDEFDDHDEIDAAKDDLFKVWIKVHWAMWW